MMSMRFRPVQLGVLAVLGLVGAADPGRADPDHEEACDKDASHKDGHKDRDKDRDHKVAEHKDHDRSRDLNYVFFYDDNTTSMAGNLKDIDRARRFKQPKEQVLWFRDGSQEYVIRDPATLKQLEVTWKPVREIGDAQGKLGEQQGELGKQQGEIGARMGVIGTRQGTLAVRESALDMRASSDTLSPSDRDQIARQRQELRHQQRALRKEMKALEKPMRELGDRMTVLGRQMDALGRQMDAASQKAEAELRAVFKRAIASGVAKPVA